MSKKTVLKLDIHCEKCKRKALKSVAGVEGVNSVAIDVKEKKITIIGDADPVNLTTKLRKFGSTELLTVGPAKEEKKDDKKPDDAKKNEPKKDEAKKVESKMEPPTVVFVRPVGNPGFDCYTLSDENPNACCIS